MSKLTEVQIYEKILKSINSNAIELGEKIKNLVGPAEEEIVTYNNLVRAINDCKELIRLLTVKEKSEYEKLSGLPYDESEIQKLKSLFEAERNIITQKDEDIHLNGEAQVDEYDPDPRRSGRFRN
jgi:hypothetical protein